jgi:hypothetical protein
MNPVFYLDSIVMLRIFLWWKAIISLSSIHRFVFLMQAHYLPTELQNESSYVTWINFSLQK